MNKVCVFRGNDHVDHKYLVSANCFFFPPVPLGDLCNLNLAARPGRIEVSDGLAVLHSHDGLTLAFVVSGYGILKTQDEEFSIQAGDILVIPAHALHVSIAAPNTVLIEHSIFIGNPHSFDAKEV